MLPMCFISIFSAFFLVLTGFDLEPNLDPRPNPDFDLEPCSNQGLRLGVCWDSQTGHCAQPQPNPQYIVLPQYNPTIGSIFSNAPSVAIFTNTFIQAVYKSDILRQAFDFSQTTALQYSQFEYEYSLKIFNNYGIKNAASVAEFSTRAIAPNFDVLTMPLMARIKVNAVANFLFVEGILRIDNAKKLALAYAETNKNHAQAIMTADPTSKFRVTGQAFLNFILSVDDDAIAKIPLIAFYLGNEWFVANVNYKWINM